MDDKTIEILKDHGLFKNSFLPLIQIDSGILNVPQSLEPTKSIEKFYEASPFPNYIGIENKADLLRKLERNTFYSDLKQHVGFGKRFIEVGIDT